MRLTWAARVVAGVVVVAGGLVAGPLVAQAETTGNWYHQQSRTGGGVGSYAHFGGATDTVLVGDWNGDGRDSYAVRRGNDYSVSNSPAGGATSYTFRFGSAGDVVLVGDWNGDGVDTLGVRRGNMYYLTDAPRGGVANRVFKYGSGGDVVLVGDWNGDRKDTLGVRRGNVYYFTNTQGGVAQLVSKFGSGSDVVITGDWNGDRVDTLGVRRGNIYHLTNRAGGGPTDVVETFGAVNDSAYLGDWNGDRVDTLAVRRAIGPPRTIAGSGSFDVPSQAAPGLYKSAATADMCYWERVSDFTASLESIIANSVEFDTWPLYVEIKPTDAGFQTDGCATWAEARATDPVRYLTIDNGQYRIGKDIAPGRYQAPGGASCYWELTSDFSQEMYALLANDFGGTSPIVDVYPGDAGFASSDCGTWNRIGDVTAGAARVAPRKVSAPRPVAGRP